MSENAAQGVRWDLSDLYPSITDPKVSSDLELAASKAIRFEKKFKPIFENLKDPGSFPLPELLKDYKEIITLTVRLGTFSQLSFAEKTNDPARGAFLQKIQVALTDIQTHLLFFDVYWNQLDEKIVSQILQNPSLRPDLHFLWKMRSFAPHTLKEGEEKILAVKSNTGGRAFSRLFDEVINKISFSIELDGKIVNKNESEILALFHSPVQGLRKKASESLAEGLKTHTHLLTYTTNMILADHRSDLKIRHFRHPMDPMNLCNEIDLKSVLNLVACVKEAYPLAARYYRLKARLLGLDRLYDYDRYAPIGKEDVHVDFKECREVVMAGYRAFSEDVAGVVEPFFTKHWIDAEVRDGKQGGGFCCGTTPEIHPYILVNYTGSLRDVMTVAHELGHGLHQTLAGKAGILECHAPLTLAETASVFGEMLIFEKLLENEKSPRKKLELICGKIDDNFATVFRQIAMTDFELMAHEAGVKEGELSEETLNSFWIKANADLYGDSVTLTDHYRHGWKYIPHFIHSPFYCYAYAFAQLFVLTLYQKYKEDPKGFVPKYLEMLSLGGSRKPAEIAAIAGLDFKRPDFWQSGLRLLEELMQQAEKLAES